MNVLKTSLLGLALLSAAPAIAQQTDHSKMGHAAPASMPETKQKAETPVDHSRMDHSKMDHAAMGHAVPAAADLPRVPIPVPTDADRTAAVPPSGGHAMHGESRQHYVAFNRLEGFDGGHGRGQAWEGQAWVGGDLDKLWLRSEGEHEGGRTASADVELLYGRAVARWWDVVAGVRHDFKPGASQDFVAIGVQGLAPYKFEVQATAYLGTSGQTGAQVEVEYETLLTNRLILQPSIELEFHGRSDARRGIGSGLGTAEAGLRLRYEFSRQFAPYIGIVRERAFGNTASLRRAAGEDADDTRLVFGVRAWF